MTVSLIIFWLSAAVLFYCYFGYAGIAFLFTRLKKIFRSQKRKDIPASGLAPVTLIITAFNEETVLEQKIRNTLEINYPADKLSVIFVTDGSTDGSGDIIRKYPIFTLLHQQDRKGKYAAIKRAMRQVKTPVVIFSDANSMLNRECILHIVSHYASPSVGAVAGEKRVVREQHSVVGEAEGLYWQYESFLKKMDAGLYTVTGAAGELFSIRSSLFKELDDEIILDDFICSMQVCMQGYRIDYEPDAFATEHPSASLAEEEKRKVRISAGAYQSIGYLTGCMNFIKQPLLAFQFISRRLLRWIFCPVLIICLLASNIFIATGHHSYSFYNWTLYLQIVFYLLAAMGLMLAGSGKKTGLLTIPFYFVFMNYCLVKGFFKFIRRKQTVLWEKSLRQAIES
jgi:poly-beta-1,6-N-acetyl-D-glucosamine synthase